MESDSDQAAVLYHLAGAKREVRGSLTTDGDLVREALGGQGEAYAELVRRWTARVLAVCHARVRRSGMAEDLAHEAILRGYAGLGTLSDPQRFGPWLCGIATRVCLDWLKAKERTQVTFSDLGRDSGVEGSFADPRSGDTPRLDGKEEVDRLLAAVEELPEPERQVILLYYYDDVTYRDLAEVLGVSPATVNMRLTKARALLRRRLDAARR
jgi:RNA polymerase sigma-70 factor (ECF subfamily)